MVLFSLYPQFKLWHARGQEFNGAYAYNDIDEVAYSAYLQALIDGRSRRNDPYTGADLTDPSALRESFFSVQFATPMLLAVPARVLHLSSSRMMMASGAMGAFAATLAIFFLLVLLTGDSRLAAAGALAILCLGTLAAGEGAIYELTDRGVAYPYFPFLRRYLPAIPFPVFFLFCAALWRAVANPERRRRLVWPVVAVASFGFLVYSYFYLWTTAAAFLVCFAFSWVVSRPKGERNGASFAGIGLGCGLMAMPYFWLLSHRDQGVDDMSVLVRTHRPDFARIPEYIVLATFLVLALAILRRRFAWRDPVVALVVSLGLCVFAVFNQQILTGRSLQPIHYQVFIGNYLAALAAFVALWLVWRGSRATLTARWWGVAAIAIVALGWGTVEAKYTTRVLDGPNVVRDQAVPVERYLAAEAAKAGPDGCATTVLAMNFLQSDDLPTFAPQPVLWARHQYVFTGTSWAESKRRFYQFLYYNDLTPEAFEAQLEQGNFVFLIAVFGWGRPTERLTSEPNPITDSEIATEVASYTKFFTTFGRDQAAEPELKYLVKHARAPVDLTNVDRWYDRGTRQEFGDFVLYPLRLKAIK